MLRRSFGCLCRVFDKNKWIPASLPELVANILISASVAIGRLKNNTVTPRIHDWLWKVWQTGYSKMKSHELYYDVTR